MTVRTQSKPPTPEQKAARDDLLASLKRHTHLRADEMLAVASYLVGQLVAFQDQRFMTAEMAMAIVTANIEAGNHQAQLDVLSASGPAN